MLDRQDTLSTQKTGTTFFISVVQIFFMRQLNSYSMKKKKTRREFDIWIISPTNCHLSFFFAFSVCFLLWDFVNSKKVNTQTSLENFVFDFFLKRQNLRHLICHFNSEFSIQPLSPTNVKYIFIIVDIWFNFKAIVNFL